MKDFGTVQGSMAQAVPLVVGTDVVYVHTEITPITEDQEGNPVEGLFSYHEIQYEKDEYIRMMAEKNTDLEAGLTDTQLALCDVYELLGG